MENNTTFKNNSVDIITENSEKKQGANENIIQTAIDKINKEAEIASGQNVPAVAIYNYLLNKCSNSEEFSSLVIVDSKSISKCFTYVTDKAFEAAARQNITANRNAPMGIGMSSEEIFALVDEYFTLDDAVIEERKESERKARDEARRTAEETRKAQSKAKAENHKKVKTEKKTEKKPETPPADNAQMSLFD